MTKPPHSFQMNRQLKDRSPIGDLFISSHKVLNSSIVPKILSHTLIPIHFIKLRSHPQYASMQLSTELTVALPAKRKLVSPVFTVNKIQYPTIPRESI